MKLHIGKLQIKSNISCVMIHFSLVVVQALCWTILRAHVCHVRGWLAAKDHVAARWGKKLWYAPVRDNLLLISVVEGRIQRANTSSVCQLCRRELLWLNALKITLRVERKDELKVKLARADKLTASNGHQVLNGFLKGKLHHSHLSLFPVLLQWQN